MLSTQGTFKAIHRLASATAAEWQDTTQPIPVGMFVYESDTKYAKIGNGVDAYADLDYFIGEVLSPELLAYLEMTNTAGHAVVLNEEGLVNLGNLPPLLGKAFIFVGTIAERDAIPEVDRVALVCVLDATGDPSVESGAAFYGWNSGSWLKVAEAESFDIHMEQFLHMSTNTLDDILDGETYVNASQMFKDTMNALSLNALQKDRIYKIHPLEPGDIQGELHSPVVTTLELYGLLGTEITGQFTATDADGHYPLSYNLLKMPTKGTVEVSLSGAVTYRSKPKQSDAYTESFTILCRDAYTPAYSSVGTCNVTVFAVYPYIIGDRDYLLAKNNTLSSNLSVFTNGTISDMNISWSISATPSHGGANVTATGNHVTFTYLPATDYIGNDMFTVTVDVYYPSEDITRTYNMIVNVVISEEGDLNVASTSDSIDTMISDTSLSSQEAKMDGSAGDTTVGTVLSQ